MSIKELLAFRRQVIAGTAKPTAEQMRLMTLTRYTLNVFGAKYEVDGLGLAYRIKS